MSGGVHTIECRTCQQRIYGDPAALAATMNTDHARHRWGPVRPATTGELVDLVMRGAT